MSWIVFLAGGLSAVLLIYLVVALLEPEWFQ